MANDSTVSLALSRVSTRNIGHCGDDLSGLQVTAGDIAPCDMAGYQPKNRYECFGFTAGIRVGSLQDSLGDAL